MRSSVRWLFLKSHITRQAWTINQKRRMHEVARPAAGRWTTWWSGGPEVAGRPGPGFQSSKDALCLAPHVGKKQAKRISPPIPPPHHTIHTHTHTIIQQSNSTVASSSRRLRYGQIFATSVLEVYVSSNHLSRWSVRSVVWRLQNVNVGLEIFSIVKKTRN